MHEIRLPLIGTVAAWRENARKLVLSGVEPEAVIWTTDQGTADLFASARQDLPDCEGSIRMSRDAISSIETALCHSDPERFSCAYRVLFSLHRKTSRWPDRSDRAIGQVLAMEKSVRRDIHKMHAFVRFREVDPIQPGRRAFAAWFEPDHHCVEAASPFFAKRFGDMDWVIATPHITARFEAGVLSHELTSNHTPPPPDASEALWRTYFSSIFNPARLMVDAMTSEMPKKYWKNLPEADLIPDMIRTASERARKMQAAAPSIAPDHVDRIRYARDAQPVLGRATTLEDLKRELDHCRRCPLSSCATQAVCGEGPEKAHIMIVGEQPGDMEDLAGRPFVGPAGAVFDTALATASLDRRDLYITNAVKHFKFTPRGKRRIHQRPNAGEVQACKWWLDFEIGKVSPKLIVAMGSTAALALTGNEDKIARRRGTIERSLHGIPVLLTWHPSFILRAREQAETAMQELTCDLLTAHHHLADNPA